MTAVDADRFRAVMAAVCAPVTIVTAVSADGHPCGATVSSFTSLSLDPPLVAVAFDRRSALLASVRGAGRFGVNLLGEGQDDLAVLFATRGADRFGGETAWFADDGLPRLRDAAGWVACDLDRTVEAGDHQLLFGRVTALGRAERPPLVYAHRTFGTHSRYAERPRPPITDLIAACAR
ncbi:flavin reductase family protein [Amycolatopsis sp., V23-08]|uniref:Flavin reductase family protein n=1 Tax=Amycolatopsis heterodermiae TaxID=3110235 RepID=A0ABU5RLY9_9PSEU|nr:flavin reductase family protein [Amycolatopsis sp., V23-08]MEA5367302.1 flavin reductase family protein [Amycolatopsis sp., V23-08]